MKKTLSILLSITLIIFICPMGLFNITTSAKMTGYTGSCNWSLEGYVLTIFGNGKMGEYSVTDSLPWTRKITKVIIENGVTSIGKGAFYGCTSLYSVTVPDSVTSIGDYAFCDCTDIESITIPSVTSIGKSAFYGCTNMKSVILNSNDVVGLGSEAFSNTGLTSIENLNILYGNFAFKNCKKLTSVTISGEQIGERMFEGCKELKKIVISSSVKNIGEKPFDSLCLRTAGPIGGGYDYEFGWDSRIPSNAFSGSHITSITMPSTIKSIGEGAFQHCFFKSIVIPSGITEIYRRTFWNCIDLESITLPNSITFIGERAFYDCYKLKDIYYTGTKKQYSNIIFDIDVFSAENVKLHYNSCIGTSDHISSTDIKENLISPTCGVLGSYENVVYCLICGIEISRTKITIPATGEHIYDNVCDQYCNICGNERTDIHLYDNNCDDTCNICGYKRNALHVYDDECDETCNICGYKRKASHIFDGRDDLICNNCGYERPPYIPGDVNDDDTVTDADAVYLLMYTFFPDDYPVNQDCDFNRDGTVTDADAVYLLMYTFFPEDYPIE